MYLLEYYLVVWWQKQIYYLPFVEWAGELLCGARLNTLKYGAEAKASLNRAYSVFLGVTFGLYAEKYFSTME